MRHRALLAAGCALLIGAWLAPAGMVLGRSLTGAQLALQMSETGRGFLAAPTTTAADRVKGLLMLMAVSANILVPLLAFSPPRFRVLERWIVIATLAASAWLCGRAVAGTFQFSAGVLLWWGAMGLLGGYALWIRR